MPTELSWLQSHAKVARYEDYIYGMLNAGRCQVTEIDYTVVILQQ